MARLGIIILRRIIGDAETGYLGTGANTEYFLFDIPKFESTHLFSVFVTEGLGITFKEFEKPRILYTKILVVHGLSGY